MSAASRADRSRTLPEILARKRELVERGAAQRRALAESTAGLAPAFAAGDRALGVVRSVLLNPVVLAAGGVLLIVLFPRAVGRAAVRGFTIWNALRAVRRLTASHAH